MVSSINRLISFLIKVLLSIFVLGYVVNVSLSEESSTALRLKIHDSAVLIEPYYAPIQPYVSQGSEYIHEKVLDPTILKVSEVYDEHLQEHVEKVYNDYLKDHLIVCGNKASELKLTVQDKVVEPLISKVIQPSYLKSQLYYESVIQPQLQHYSLLAKEHGKVYFKKLCTNGRDAAEYSRVKAIEYLQAFKHNLVTVYVPASIRGCNKVLKFVNSIAKPKIVAAYDNYVRPHLTKYYYACQLDVAVDYVYTYFLKVINSAYFVKLHTGAVKLYKDLIPQSYDEVEVKKDFVKAEFNKIFDAGFKLSNDFHEGIKNSNKLIKDKLYNNPESVETETEVESTTVATETATVGSATLSVSTISDKSEPTKAENPICKSVLHWKSLVSKTCELALEDFVTEVSLSEKATIDLYQPKLTSGLQDFSNLMHSGVKNLTLLISTIKDTDLSRAEFREVLKKLSDDLSTKADVVTALLKELSSNTSTYISEERRKILENLEEFSDFAVEEFRREVMTGRNKDDEYWSDWKEMSKIKDTMFESKEKLSSFAPELKDLNKIIKEIEFTLSLLINESGQHLALLRAKANLLFQLREEAEKASETNAESTEDSKEAVDVEEDFDDEEVETITKQVTKQITVTVDDNLEPIETSEPEVEADVEVENEVEAELEDEVEAEVEDEDVIEAEVEETEAEDEVEDEEEVGDEAEEEPEDSTT